VFSFFGLHIRACSSPSDFSGFEIYYSGLHISLFISFEERKKEREIDKQTILVESKMQFSFLITTLLAVAAAVVMGAPVPCDDVSIPFLFFSEIYLYMGDKELIFGL